MSKVIVGEHLDYTWEEEHIEIAIKMALEEYNITEIAETLDRDLVETLILIDELLFIRRRPKKNNILGPRKEKHTAWTQK